MNGAETSRHLKPTQLRFLVRFVYTSYVVAAFETQISAEEFKGAHQHLEIFDNHRQEVIKTV